MRVVSHHEHRRVIRRLRTPPTAPIGCTPLTARGTEHVAAHDVRPARPEQALGERLVRGMLRILEMPPMKLLAVNTKRMLLTLIGPGDEAVERDRHVAGDERRPETL